MSVSTRTPRRPRDTDAGLRRELLVLAGALVLVVVLAVAALGLGEIAISPGAVLAALVGRADRVTDFVITELRGPRLLAAVLVGASLGTAGGIVQSVVRNPIASPDVIGITSGASASGITAIALFAASGLTLFSVVVVGAVLVTVVIAALSWRGGIGDNRLVLVGVGVAAIAVSVTGWMLTRGNVQDAAVALVWLTGSLNAVDPTVLAVLAVAFVVLFVLALLQSPRLGVLTLGDDVAASLGLPPDRAKVLLVLTAVGLSASAVAAAGPVSFVALMAAPIARRLVGRGRVAVAPAAAVGAVIVQASDLVAQFAIPGVAVPVGVVTGIVGAPYLLWLIARGR
ncbi:MULTISPECIES: iron chelate uptake ABC transporter family permease subunit [unclassified Curtobacterium]|uniref:FecCD family ABC transporter permease n=1 Tax=unclassified Curtobacterium TaxID=257496 RepID=UPI0021AC197B|nr:MULTISPECIES: iron ABC transporter permease [unclassified Curtobacterium]